VCRGRAWTEKQERGFVKSGALRETEQATYSHVNAVKRAKAPEGISVMFSERRSITVASDGYADRSGKYARAGRGIHADSASAISRGHGAHVHVPIPDPATEWVICRRRAQLKLRGKEKEREWDWGREGGKEGGRAYASVSTLWHMFPRPRVRRTSGSGAEDVERQRGRDREVETERQRQRQRDRGRERQRERARDMSIDSSEESEERPLRSGVLADEEEGGKRGKEVREG
jgi:hypothetical protein